MTQVDIQIHPSQTVRYRLIGPHIARIQVDEHGREYDQEWVVHDSIPGSYGSPKHQAVEDALVQMRTALLQL